MPDKLIPGKKRTMAYKKGPFKMKSPLKGVKVKPREGGPGPSPEKKDIIQKKTIIPSETFTKKPSKWHHVRSTRTY